MGLRIPKQVEEVARRLHREGFRYAEAVPIHRWKQEGWPTDDRFFQLVDACIRILRALELP